MSRPPYQPTDRARAQIRLYSAMGTPQKDICKVMGISLPTLHKYYRDDLDRGMIEANAKVAEALFKKAIGNENGSIAAAIWWTKTRMGWSEKIHHEVDMRAGVLVVPAEASPQDWIEEVTRDAEIKAVEDGLGSNGQHRE